MTEDDDLKDFEEFMWKPKLSLRWGEVAKWQFLHVWMEARRTLREKQKEEKDG